MTVQSEVFRAWHIAATNNKKRLEEAGSGYCGYCLKKVLTCDLLFMSEADGRETAMCPHCQVDCVVPSDLNVTDEKLRLFHKEWFG